MPDTKVPNKAQVPIRDEDGSISLIDAKDLPQAKKEGARLATPEEFKKVENEEKYGGVGGALKTTAINAADSATLGFGKGIAGQIGGKDTADYIKNLDETNPTSAMVGQAAGIAVPALGELAAAGRGARAAGTAGRVLEAASAPMRGLGAIGGLAEKGAAALVGKEATSVGGRVLQSALPMAARGAVEGAAFGAGQAYSEDVLGDHEVTAENLLAGIGHGVLIGGAAGGFLGGVGSLGKQVAEKASDLVGNTAGKFSLDELANKKAVESLGVSVRDYKRYSSNPEKAAEMVNELGAFQHEKGLLGYDALEKANVLKKETGGKLNDLITKADETGVKPNVDSIATRVEEKILKPLEGMKTQTAEAGAVRNFLEDFKTQVGENPTHAEMWKFRQFLDEKAGMFTKSQSSFEKGVGAELKKFRGVLEDEMKKSGTEALGEEFATQWKQHKDDYRKLSEISKLASNEEFKAMKPGGFGGLKDMAHAALGGSVAGLPGAVAATVAHRLWEERGAEVTARLLKSMATASNRVDGDLAKGVESFFKSTPTKAAEASRSEPLKVQYTKLADQVKQATANPVATAETAMGRLGGIAQVAPITSGHMAALVTRATDFLASKLPQGHIDSKSMTPHLEAPTVSDAEMSKFVKYASAVNKPQTVVTDMQKGRLSREQTEAVKHVYPKLYERMQQQAIQQIMGLKKKLPYQKRLQLGIMLDIPADKTMNRQFIQQMQSAFMPVQGQGKSHGSSSPKRPLDIAKYSLTEYQGLGIGGM